MNSPTSLESYAHLVSSGILAERQLEAWIALAQWGPMTGRELDEQTGRRGLWKRLSELKSLGLVKEREVRHCRVSKRAALVWEHCSISPTQALLTKRIRPNVFYLAMSPVGQIHYVGGNRELADTWAKKYQCEVVKLKETRRYIPA